MVAFQTLLGLVAHRDEITHLILISGFDFMMESSQFFESVARNRTVAEAFEKILVPVQTNFHRLEKQHNFYRTLTYGAALAAVALALGYSRFYLPSTFTYAETDAHGSHPLIAANAPSARVPW